MLSSPAARRPRALTREVAEKWRPGRRKKRPCGLFVWVAHRISCSTSSSWQSPLPSAWAWTWTDIVLMAAAKPTTNARIAPTHRASEAQQWCGSARLDQGQCSLIAPAGACPVLARFWRPAAGRNAHRAAGLAPRGSRAMEVALGAQRRRHAACRRHCCSHKPSRPRALRARCRAAAQRLWYFTTVRVWCGRQASVPVAQQQRWCQQYGCSTPGRLPRRWRNDGSCTARRARESWLSLLHEVELPCCAVRWCSIGLHESITRTRHAHESPRR